MDSQCVVAVVVVEGLESSWAKTIKDGRIQEV
jgi:hypothetical protein